MRANKIERAKVYELKVGKNTTQVKVTAIDRNVNGTLTFVCENINTGKKMTVADDAGSRLSAFPVRTISKF